MFAPASPDSSFFDIIIKKRIKSFCKFLNDDYNMCMFYNVITLHDIFHFPGE